MLHLMFLTVVSIMATFIYDVMLFCVIEADCLSLLFCPASGSRRLLWNDGTDLLNYITPGAATSIIFLEISLFLNGQRISGQERATYLYAISITSQSILVARHSSLYIQCMHIHSYIIIGTSITFFFKDIPWRTHPVFRFIFCCLFLQNSPPSPVCLNGFPIFFLKVLT